MFEWNSVNIETFINAKGDSTQVKLIYSFISSNSNYYVKTLGRELDLIAFQELGSEYEALNLIQNNAQNLMEYNFDTTKIPIMFIP